MKTTLTCALVLAACGNVQNDLPDAGAVVPSVWVPVGDLGAYTAFSVVADDASPVVFAALVGTGNDCRLAPKQAGCDIYRSIDGGLSFAPVTADIDHVDVRGMAIAGSVVVAAARGAFGVSDDRILRSQDAGATWRVVSSSPDVGELHKAVAIDPLAPVSFYAADFQLGSRLPGDSFLIKSTDGGQFWTHLPESAGGELRGYAIAFDGQGAVYVGGTGTPALARSTDGGLTFTGLGLTDELVYAIAIDPANPATVYAGTRDHGVFRSTNSGTTFVATGTGPSGVVTALVIDPLAPATIYAATDAGVFVSETRGDSWSLFVDGLAGTGLQVNSLALTSERVLVAGTAGGLYRRGL